MKKLQHGFYYVISCSDGSLHLFSQNHRWCKHARVQCVVAVWYVSQLTYQWFVWCWEPWRILKSMNCMSKENLYKINILAVENGPNFPYLLCCQVSWNVSAGRWDAILVQIDQCQRLSLVHVAVNADLYNHHFALQHYRIITFKWMYQLLLIEGSHLTYFKRMKALLMREWKKFELWTWFSNCCKNQHNCNKTL